MVSQATIIITTQKDKLTTKLTEGKRGAANIDEAILVNVTAADRLGLALGSSN